MWRKEFADSLSHRRLIMIEVGSEVGGKYLVTGLCSDSGGMGTIVFVNTVNTDTSPDTPPLVLKYCKETDEEILRRFKREVRLLNEYRGNSKVVQIFDHNLEYDPPYFVMQYYPDGDLSTLGEALRADFTLQEQIFYQMIDCINELHLNGQFHRDIKPQNFLRDGDQIIVSDFGLSTELESSTAFTRSSQYWGTPGYLPPEYYVGGFKNVDAAGDIFMLGKSFYNLLTGRGPMYLSGHDIPPALFLIIERCCVVDKNRRYQSLAELKQNLKAAYDLLLDRVEGAGKANQLLTSITDRLEKDGQYRPEEVIEFIDAFAMLYSEARIKVSFELPEKLFLVLRDAPFQAHLATFLEAYREMVENGSYSWSYAEVIADRMYMLFESEAVSDADKTFALELAVIAAQRQSRFAAMDTCTQMIKSVTDENLGIRIRDLIQRYPYNFLTNIEPSECSSNAIGSYLSELRKAQSEQEDNNVR
jgi:serine/threonine protein kinase